MAISSAQKSKKFNDANRRLKGIESHNGFLSDETLLRIASSDDHKASLNALMNERLRSFRDEYRTFAEKTENYVRKGDDKRYGEALKAWTAECVSYLGYKGFVPAVLDHPEKGQISYLKPSDDTHTVAVFFSVGTKSPLRIFESGRLTDGAGDCHYESSRGETLAEQVERALKATGLSEALVVLPHSAYYLRSESATSEQCLEVRWDDVMSADFDDALALATYLLRADFFCFKATDGAPSDDEATTDESMSDDDDATEGDVEEGEDGESSGASVKLTPSSLLFKEDLEQSRAITEQLHKQVVLALEFLVNERLAVDPDLMRRAKSAASNEKIAYELFKDGLFVLYRVLFVLYAEARGFLPVENEMFASFYSLEHLRDWSEKYLRKLKRGAASPRSTYLWGALNSIFTLLRRGVTLNGEEVVSPFNGQLFSPDRAPLFDQGPALRDEAIAKVFTALTRVGGDSSARNLHFGNLGVEQLGAVYEAMLAQKPTIVREKSIWVPAHGGGVGLVTEEFAHNMALEIFETQAEVGRAARRKASGGKKMAKGSLDNHIDSRRPAYDPSIGKFIVAPLGGAKRATASFYTPPKLAEFLVRRTLKPLVEGKSAEEILRLKVVEPAMGSGGFIIATVRYLADELLKAKRRDRKNYPEISREQKASFRDLQRCKREVIENCIYGVDINPLAIELARTSLYLEALVKGEPLPFLHHRLKSGNSLIGADLQGRALSRWEDDGPEFPMVFELPVHLIKTDKKLFEYWDAIPNHKISGADLAVIQSDRLKQIRQERKKIDSAAWSAWATARQTKVTGMLHLARAALMEFEKSQSEINVIDTMDERHKDHLAHIPDMDQVLIEAYEVPVDESLLRNRRKALIAELGLESYKKAVMRQRSYYRLKAIGDISVALWYWPLDRYMDYPDHGTFKELMNWLTDESTLSRDAKPKQLSKSAFKALRTALRTARQLNAFHWDVEFANVFADNEFVDFQRGGSGSTGFHCLISNPPWKVVGVKDKEIYPHFDPQFMSTAASNKGARIKSLYKSKPESAQHWYDEAFRTSHMTEHWRKGNLAEIAPEGKVDLAALFTLRSERLARKHGRSGLVVSRSSLFVNKASKNIRERFFGDWGLIEACSFVNKMGIFEIASNIEFSLLIGEHGRRQKKPPRFVHALIDPNGLDVVGKNLEIDDLSRIKSGPKPAEISKEAIGKYFAKETVAIPGITDPRQVEIAMALHKASGPVVYVDELDVLVQQGINQNTGPKKGLSEYTEKIPPRELPKWEDVLDGKIGKWVPLYRGRDFDLFSPFGNSDVRRIYPEQYGSLANIERQGVDISKKTLLWRKISSVQDQRSLISSLIPAYTWASDGSYCVQTEVEEQLWALQAFMSSVSLDFLTKLKGGTNRTMSEIAALPITQYASAALDGAVVLAKKIFNMAGSDVSERRALRAKVDALVWLHYGMGRAPLDRSGLEWVLNTQFDCLNRHDPEYKNLVLKAYDEYSKEPKYTAGPTGTIFTKKTDKVASLPEPTDRKPTREPRAKRTA